MGAAFFNILGFSSQLLLASAVLAGGGYLARVGPKPLRFEQVAPRQDPDKVLPPLTMPDKTSSDTSTTLLEFGPQPQDDSAAESANLQMLGPELPPAREDDGTASNARQETPNALLQFFHPSTRRETVISTPVEFTPPSPASGKSSSATYISR